jgi:hypothetical protein
MTKKVHKTPEVRQCTDPEDSQYGAVAVKSNLPGLDWGVMNPANGGHWATDEEVADWTKLEPADAPAPTAA